MPSKSPHQRSLISAIGAHERAARYDGREVTARARSAFLARFLREVDDATPGLPEAERQRRAGHLLKAHMKRLALASSKARSNKAATPTTAGPT